MDGSDQADHDNPRSHRHDGNGHYTAEVSLL